MSKLFLFGSILLVILLSPPASAKTTESGKDPYQSAAWLSLKKEYLANQTIVFDERVKVSGPEFAEDALNVPIKFDATALTSKNNPILKIMVLVDRNPIRKVLVYEPLKFEPILSFRIKLEQASPIRVLVQTKDKVWHVGSTWIESAGGGCTLPAGSRADGSWSESLNRVQTKYFVSQDQNSIRLRTRIMHPMDTGLVSGIPSFHIESLEIRDKNNAVWMKLAIFEPISENPTLSFDLPANTPKENLVLVGNDNNGNLIRNEILW